VRLLADAEPGLNRDAEQVRLKLPHVCGVPVRGQLIERRPMLPIGRHPLALVGADGAHVDRLGVLDGASSTDPQLEVLLSRLVGWLRLQVVTKVSPRC
jgi:hypothetical protein